MICWRRLRDWQQEGLWDLMHFALLNWLAREDDIDWSRAIVNATARPVASPSGQAHPPDESGETVV